nr:MAG TPA: hypothetical protein [Caudoviricetes sp.]
MGYYLRKNILKKVCTNKNLCDIMELQTKGGN